MTNPRQKPRSYENSLSLCIRLVLVMGLGWSLELVHTLVYNQGSVFIMMNVISNVTQVECGGVVDIVLKIGGSFNVARGFFIFLIFICKKRIFVKIRKIFFNESVPTEQLRSIRRLNTTTFRFGVLFKSFFN